MHFEVKKAYSHDKKIIKGCRKLGTVKNVKSFFTAPLSSISIFKNMIKGAK